MVCSCVAGSVRRTYSFPKAFQILSRLPSPFAVWVITALVRMRERGVTQLACAAHIDGNNGATASGGDAHSSQCAACGDSAALLSCPLVWGSPCNHVVCETCVWQRLAARPWDNHLCCPCCGAAFTSAQPARSLPSTHNCPTTGPPPDAGPLAGPACGPLTGPTEGPLSKLSRPDITASKMAWLQLPERSADGRLIFSDAQGIEVLHT